MEPRTMRLSIPAVLNAAWTMLDPNIVWKRHGFIWFGRFLRRTIIEVFNNKCSEWDKNSNGMSDQELAAETDAALLKKFLLNNYFVQISFACCYIFF